MKITAIAKIYWKQIKAGSKTYTQVLGADKQEQVKELAGQDVYDAVITPEEYEGYIGEPYAGELPPASGDNSAEEVIPDEEGENTEEPEQGETPAE